MPNLDRFAEGLPDQQERYPARHSGLCPYNIEREDDWDEYEAFMEEEMHDVHAEPEPAV